MSKKWLKKSLAILMAATMVVSMSGCSKKEEKKSEEKKQDTKEMVYEGSELEIEGIEGDISTVSVHNGKLYVSTYEMPEEMSEIMDETVVAEDEEVVAEETADEVNAESEDTAESVSEDEMTSEEDADSEEETDADLSDAAEEVVSEEDMTDVGEETADSENEATDENADSESESADSETEENAEDEEATDADSEEINFDEMSDEELEEYYAELEAQTVERLYSMNPDGSDVKEIPYPKFEATQGVQSMAVGADGTMLFLLSAYDMKTESSTYSIYKMDEQGNELANEDITKLLKLTEQDYISEIALDEKGRVVIAKDQSVYILDESLTSAEELKPEGGEAYLSGLATTKDGKIVCGNSTYEDESSSVVLQVVDTENKKWGEKYELDVAYLMGPESLMDGAEYDVYYSDESGIYGYDIASTKSTKLMDFVASNITSESTYGMVPVAKDQFVGTTYEEDGTTHLVSYNKVDASTIADKTVITFGAMWVDDTVKKNAIEFNKNSDKYQIEFKEYMNEEDPITKMNADIVAGNVPDILSLSSLPFEQYVAKGLLEDLTPYFEKDEEVKIEDLLDSVEEAIQIDGKVYYIAPSFYVSTLVGKTSDVGTGTGWTFDEMKAVIDEKGDSARPFFYENKSEMLYGFCMGGLNDFVNWQTGECSFDGQAFKDILEICNEKGVNEETEYDEDTNYVSQYQEGKVLFTEGWVTPEEVQVYSQMFGEDITFIGYPNAEKQGSYFNFDSQLAIYSKSEVKEGAWEFIRTFMTKEYQATNSRNMAISAPTRQDCFDMMLKAKTTTEAYTDEFGQEITPLESSYGMEDLEVEIRPLSKEQEELYVNLVNNTKKVGSSDEDIMEIVTEESKTYFSGEKSLDEVADVIQNRVTTYVNENR